MKKGWRKLLIIIIVPVAMIGVGPLVPLPFNEGLWKTNFGRRNMIWQLNSGQLVGRQRADIVQMLGTPARIDLAGVDSKLFAQKGDSLYFFVPVFWENCAFVVWFDPEGKVRETRLIDGQ